MNKKRFFGTLLMATFLITSCGHHKDTIKPVFEGVEETKSCEVGTTLNLLEGVTAIDNVDGDLTGKIKVSINPVLTITNGSITFEEDDIGTYVVSYIVKDKAGNEETALTNLEVIPAPIEFTEDIAYLELKKAFNNTIAYTDSMYFDATLTFDINYSILDSDGVVPVLSQKQMEKIENTYNVDTFESINIISAFNETTKKGDKNVSENSSFNAYLLEEGKYYNYSGYQDDEQLMRYEKVESDLAEVIPDGDDSFNDDIIDLCYNANTGNFLGLDSLDEFKECSTIINDEVKKINTEENGNSKEDIDYLTENFELISEENGKFVCRYNNVVNVYDTIYHVESEFEVENEYIKSIISTSRYEAEEEESDVIMHSTTEIICEVSFDYKFNNELVTTVKSNQFKNVPITETPYRWTDMLYNDNGYLVYTEIEHEYNKESLINALLEAEYGNDENAEVYLDKGLTIKLEPSTDITYEELIRIVKSNGIYIKHDNTNKAILLCNETDVMKDGTNELIVKRMSDSLKIFNNQDYDVIYKDVGSDFILDFDCICYCNDYCLVDGVRYEIDSKIENLENKTYKIEYVDDYSVVDILEYFISMLF